MKRTTTACVLAVMMSGVLLPEAGGAAEAEGTRVRKVAATVVAPASAPSLTATPVGLRVMLQWTAVPGATAYWIFRSTTDTWNEPPVGKTNGQTFKNWGLTGGTRYVYRVAAANGRAVGPLSNAAEAMPLSPPADPVAEAGNARATLRWTPSAGAAAYDVFRSKSWSAGDIPPIATGVTGSTFVDTGLTNGMRYYYRLRATAPGSVSKLSTTVSARPQVPPPSMAPTGLSAVPGNGFVTLRWSAVGDATSYRIFRSSTGAWAADPFASTSATTFKNGSLTNGAAYAYRVAAVNAGGMGPLSDPISAVPAAPPSAPSDVVASAGDMQVRLSWTPVPDATSYNVYRSTTPERQGRTPLATLVTAPPYLDTTAVNGPTYYYRMTAVNAGGESARSAEVRADPEAPAAAADPETVAAFRFLRQATWGPRPGDVDLVKSVGRQAYLDAQLAAPPSQYPATLLGQPIEAMQEHFMQLALTGEDQLRQRVAWALHKIWVVSAVEVPSASAMVTYQRILMDGAFGSYRDLMRDITLNPAMGRYLNMLNNRSEAVTGALPNENYARELLQLFTMGISTLDATGLPVLDPSGRPVPAYTEQDVQALSRIFTGWTFGDGNPATAPRRLASENYRVPMEAVAAYHDTGEKQFLGRTFPAGQTAQQDLEQALDRIFEHSNVGPFVSRQIIQQLVTSNPSPAYVGDVAAVFRASGGTLGAVVRAVLAHSEAGASTPQSGKLAEPVLFVVSQLRALGASVTDHPFMSDKAEAMGQKVFYPPSVFSYFSPGYRVRGTNNGFNVPLTGPEFQGLTAVTALERANFVGALFAGAFGDNVRIDYTPFATRAADAAALVDYCNLRFMGGRMSEEERAEILRAVRTTPQSSATERAATALYLTLAVAQSQVDR